MAQQMKPSRLITRPANLKDYESVLAINRNVYEGYDYLPAMYKQMCQVPNYLPCVAEMDGKIVGFHCAYLVEDGSYFIGMASRVHPECRSQNIFRELSAFAATRVQIVVGRAVPTRTSALYSPHYKRITSSPSTGWKLKRVWNVLLYKQINEGLQEKIEQLTQVFQQRDVKHLALEETISYLTQTETLQMLRNDGDTFAYNFTWVPLSVTATNMRYVCKSSNVKVTIGPTNHCEAFSLYNSVEILNDIFRTDMYYYGKKDIDVLIAHFISCAREVIGKTKPNSMLYWKIHFPRGMDVKEVFRRLGEQHTAYDAGQPEVCITQHDDFLRSLIAHKF